VFAWSGAAHSASSAHAARRSPLETITGTEPIAVGAPANPNDPNDPATRTGESQAVVQALEVDAAGSPVPSAAPSFSVANTSIATTAALPQPSGTPLARVIAVAPGATTTIVSFPDGLTGSVPLAAYETIHPSCPAKPATSLPTNANGYRYDPTTLRLVAASDPSTADVYLTGPQCDGPFFDGVSTSAVLHMPAGYSSLPESEPIGNALTVGTFTPSGTSFDLANSQNLPSFLVIKTQTPGVFIKWRITGFQCSGTPCARGIEIDGDALASNSAMVFAY
jgi:hypothetical protein